MGRGSLNNRKASSLPISYRCYYKEITAGVNVDASVTVEMLLQILESRLYSLSRVGLGIVIAIILGSLIALLCSFSDILYEILYPFITVIKSTPVASFIILIWIFVEGRVPLAFGG